MNRYNRFSHIKNLCLIGLFLALLAICSYVHLPIFSTAFTLQIFGIYLCLFVLGAKKGLICIGVYILAGMLGLPVFSGFMGGFGVILGKTGGFIIGFLPSALLCSVLVRVFKKGALYEFLAAVISLLPCYIIGVLWFSYVYFGGISPEALIPSVTLSLLPFILPDIIKLAAAVYLGNKFNSIINKGK